MTNFRATRNWVFALAMGASVFGSVAQAKIGADKDWTTYQAEGMKTSGTLVGPGYAPHTIATESSQQRYVTLDHAGQYLEFRAEERANALVLRFSLPDAPQGGGLQSSVRLSVNGQEQGQLELSSRNAWLYGNYPFSNDPSQGKPRNFYDEIRVKGLSIEKGDLLRISKVASDAIPCSVDQVDLEWVKAPLPQPEASLSVAEFGAVGDGLSDDTEALLACLDAALAAGKTVWVPEGRYKLTRDIVLPDDARIQGAGMWHTEFVGDEALYGQADRRVRFKMNGSGIRLTDFAITGALNYRNDQEANDGIIGAICSDSVVSRIWIEHTKVGVWIYNGTNITVEGCRFRNMLADGINFCVGTSDSLMDNCTSRGTGDDCYAIWPAAFDQGYTDEHVVPGNNVIRRCSGELTFLANGASVYGGANNIIEDCEFVDIGTGCGILISTTFPTSDESRGIDNNFSGTTIVRNNRLIRCGGYDHSWAWRGSLQICMDRKSIAGLALSDIEIRDSFSDGITIVGPGSSKGQGTLSGSVLRSVTVDTVGLAGEESFALYVRKDAQGGVLVDECVFETVKNASEQFEIESK